MKISKHSLGFSLVITVHFVRFRWEWVSGVECSFPTTAFLTYVIFLTLLTFSAYPEKSVAGDLRFTILYVGMEPGFTNARHI